MTSSDCTFVIGAANSTRWAAFDTACSLQKLSVTKIYSQQNVPMPPCMTNTSRASAPLINYARLWEAYGRTWNMAVNTCKQPYVVLLENDAIFPSNFSATLHKTLDAARELDVDVLWMDDRVGTAAGPQGCCTVGLALKKSVLPRLVREFSLSNHNAYWNRYASKKRTVVPYRECLTDWYMGNLVASLRLRGYSRGIVKHPAPALTTTRRARNRLR